MVTNTYSLFEPKNLEYFDFSPISEGYALNKEPICLDSGLKFNIFPILSGAKDFSFNKKTGIFLSNFFPSSSVFETPSAPFSQDFTHIDSPITLSNGLVVSISAQYLVPTNKTVADISDVLIFEKLDGYFSIKNSNSFYLTFNTGASSLTFQTKILPDSDTQKFEYLLQNNTIVLFPYGYNKTYIVLASTPLTVIPYNYSNLYTNLSSYGLNLYSYSKQSETSEINGSIVAKYTNNPIENVNPLSLEPSVYSQNYTQNHLLLFPYENRDSQAYPLYVHGLKNYQTPEYDYSNGYSGYQNNAWIRREYDQIFTGTNQYKGLENVFLGYRGNTQKTEFYKDTLNKFFYPMISPRVSIQNSGLIQDGAKAGEIPYEADRIYVEHIDYAEFLVSPVSSLSRFDGTWGCSWLSGNSVGDSVWMDRFYNSAYYTLDQALSAETKVYHPKTVESSTNVWDESSQLYLEPGVRYAYYRVGESTLSTYVSSFDFDYGNVSGAKMLHIKNWNSSPLVDVSPYKNNGILFYNNPTNFKDTYLVLDGTNHALFSTNNTLLNSSSFTATINIKVNDWQNIVGEQIFGNYYNSGYGLINTAAITNPLFTISENVNSVTKTFNYRLLNTNNVNVDKLPNQLNKIIQKLPNFDYWVFDCVNLVGRKFDIEGKYLYLTDNTILSSHLTEISQVEVDSLQNIYLMDYHTKNLVVLDPTGIYTTHYKLSGNSFQIDLHNNVVDCYGTLSNVDSKNSLWEIVGGNLYKDKQIYANIGNVQQISFDTSDNLWILHNQYTVSKLNTISNTFDFTLNIGNASTAALDPCVLAAMPPQFRTIDFLKIPSQSSVQDVAVIVDNFDNNVYLIDSVGTMITKLNLQSLASTSDFKFYAEGDFTGYQYNRKFGSTDKSLSWKFKIAKSDLSSPQFYSLSTPTSALYAGWHQFSFVFDSYSGSAKYYIDSILVDSISFHPNVYELQFDYKSSLLLGATTIKNKVLNDLIKINDGYKFVGSVSDLRLYSKALSENQLRAIYHISPFTHPMENLYWQSPTGERNFIECVDKWYKMQVTGSKSKLFNIKLHNLSVDPSVRSAIEESLKNVITKIIPSYTELNKIEWI